LPVASHSRLLDDEDVTQQAFEVEVRKVERRASQPTTMAQRWSGTQAPPEDGEDLAQAQSMKQSFWRLPDLARVGV
jgi:hypothetical protein